MAHLTSRKALRLSYSVSQFLSAGGSLAIAIYAQSHNLALVLPLGVVSGAINFTKTYAFYGRELQDPSDKDHPPLFTPGSFSAAQGKALVVCYAFAAYVQEMGLNYMILNAFLGWLREFHGSSAIVLSPLAPQALLFIGIYTTLVNLPLMLSGEICETSESLFEILGIKADNPVIQWLRPLRNHPNFARVSIFLGCLANSIELLMSVIMMIPPPLLMSIAQTSLWLLAGTVIVLTALLSVLLVTHMMQAMYFEGDFAKKNLLISDESKTQDSEHNKGLHYYVLWASEKLFVTQIALESIEQSWSVFLIGTSLNYDSMALLSSVLQFCSVSLGNYYTGISCAQRNAQTELARYESPIPALT